jgi:hypothetical protein
MFKALEEPFRLEKTGGKLMIILRVLAVLQKILGSAKNLV